MPTGEWEEKDLGGGLMTCRRSVFSQDGRFLFCCVGPKVRVFSSNSGEEVCTLEGHADSVTAVCCSLRNSLQALTASLDGFIRLWDYTDGTLLREYNVGAPVLDMVVSRGAPLLPFLLLRQTGAPEHAKGKKGTRRKSVLVRFKLSKLKSRVLHSVSGAKAANLCCSEGGEMVAFSSGHKVYIADVKSLALDSFSHDREVTALAFHSTEACIMLGDATGRIILSYRFGPAVSSAAGASSSSFASSSSSSSLSPSSSMAGPHSVLHWHSHQVNDLVCSPDGNYLYSVGEEAVLVQWQLSTHSKQFLPRLGCPLMGITASPDMLKVAIVGSDNSIKVVDVVSRAVERVIQGVQSGRAFRRDVPLSFGLVRDPKSNHVVFKSSPNALEEYDPFRQQHVREVEVVARNVVSGAEGRPLPQCEVQNMCFSGNGTAMITVEDRPRNSEGEVSQCLKFWRFNRSSKSYEVDTRVDNPHAGRVTCLAYHPADDLLVTSARDGTFKVWSRVVQTNSSSSSSSRSAAWVCRSVGFYKRSESATACAFSPDGSLLAVAFVGTVTLWDSYTNSLLGSLDNAGSPDPIRSVHFLVGSPSLVAHTRSSLHLWDLLTCSLLWTQHVNVHALAVDPESPRFAVCVNRRKNGQGSKYSYLLEYTANSSLPLHARKNDKTFVKGLVYVCSPKVRNHRSLVYLNDRREFKALTEHLSGGQFEREEASTSGLSSSSLRVVAKSAHSQRALREALLSSSHSTAASSSSSSTVSSSSATTSAPSVARVLPSSSSSSASSSLFSGPSHLVPSLSALFGHLMDDVLRKHPSPSSTSQASAPPPPPPQGMQGVEEHRRESEPVGAAAAAAPGASALSVLRQDDFVFPDMLSTLSRNINEGKPLDALPELVAGAGPGKGRRRRRKSGAVGMEVDGKPGQVGALGEAGSSNHSARKKKGNKNNNNKKKKKQTKRLSLKKKRLSSSLDGSGSGTEGLLQDGGVVVPPQGEEARRSVSPGKQRRRRTLGAGVDGVDKKQKLQQKQQGKQGRRKKRQSL